MVPRDALILRCEGGLNVEAFRCTFAAGRCFFGQNQGKGKNQGNGQKSRQDEFSARCTF
jgi:hypothetical protein